ncbi:hypothetical protein WA158_001196 [Blastocystis sp. Blastoise]
MSRIIAFLLAFSVLVFSQDCVEPSLPFTLTRRFSSYAYEESWKIYEGTTMASVPVVSGSGSSADSSGSIKSFDVCLKFNTQYLLALYDSYGDGWGTSSLASTLTISYNGITLLTTTLPYISGTTHKSAQETFNFDVSLTPGSSWKYSPVAQTSSAWSQPSFSDVVWESFSSGHFPAISSNTRYYRTVVTVPNASTFFAYRLGISSNTGAVVYINGQEVYRYGLPLSSAITSTTPSTMNEETSSTHFVSFHKSSYITSGTTFVIGVEIHMPAGITTGEDSFDAILMNINAKEYIRSTIAGTSVCTPESANTNEKCVNLYDGNTNTKFYVSTSATFITTFQFEHESSQWINAYSVSSANDTPTRDPKEWKLYGSQDGLTWSFLDYRTNINFASRYETKLFYLRSNTVSWKYFKFEVLQNNGATAVQMSSLNFLMANQDLIQPGLQYEKQQYNYPIGNSISISPLSSGFYPYTITPALATGLNFDVATGSITGSLSSASTGTYTISGTNPDNSQQSSATITITFLDCTQPTMAQLSIKKVNKGTSDDERFIIYSSSNTILYESRGNKEGTTQSWTSCEVSGLYRVVLWDDGNNGWEPGAYLDISLGYEQNNYNLLSRLYLISGTTTTYYVNTKMDLAPHDNTWKYLPVTTVIDPAWKTSVFSDAAWSTFTMDNIPTTTSSIILFRKTFTIYSKQNMNGWDLRFKSKAGTVVYINNQEVYRNYLPAGELTTTTTPTGGDTTYKWRGVSGPMKQINGNTVTIAIGLVNTASTTPSNINFDAYFQFLAGSSNVSMVSDYSSFCSASWNDGSCDNVFDYNISTRYISDTHDSVSPRHVGLSFNNQRAVYANKYCVISNWDAPRHDPVDWTVYGSMDGDTYTQLATLSNVSWEFRQQRQCFYMALNTQAWIYYKLEFTKAFEIQSENRYAITEFELLLEDLDSIVLPSLSFDPSNLVAYKGIVVPALLVSSEYYSNFRITPALPAGLSMDTSNGYFNGVPTTLLSPTVYTITASNPQGIDVATTITFSIISCQSPNILFGIKLVFEGDAVEASWKLIDPFTNNVIDSQTTSISWATQYFSFCKPAQAYTLELGDSANDGWGNGYYEVLLEDGTLVSTGTVANGESPKTVTVNVGYLLVLGQGQWKYLNDGSEAPSGWNQPSFSDAAWSVGVSGNLPAHNGITQYYRHTFTIPNDNNIYAGIEFRFASYAGMIVYINGQNVYSVNMPKTNNIISTTLATAETESYVLYSFSLSVQYGVLQSGVNKIAIEIHKMANVPEINGFDGSISLLATGEYRVKDGSSWCDIDKHDSEGIEKLFDNNIQTKVVTGPRCVGSIFEWLYNNNRKEYINHYKVTNANDCNRRHPSGWKIEGSNDDNNWTLLHTTSGIFFSSFKQTKSFDFYNENSYQYYRMVVTECNNPSLSSDSYCGDGNIQLSEWGLYIDRIGSVCAADGEYSAALEGDYSYKSCPTGYSGYKRRQCSNGVLGTEESLCILVEPSELSYSGSPFTFYKNIPLNIYATIAGAELTVSISPSLPSGIVLNTVTGALSGTPLVESSLTEYTITATNSAGSISATIMIQVSSAKCSSENGWPLTDAGQTATQPCPDTINYEGSITRLCSLAYPAVWQQAIDTCVIKMPTLTYSTTTIHGFKDDAITPIVPTKTGINIVSFTISPELPQGLSFNGENGQISGIPLIASSTTHVVSLQNSRGTATSTINIVIESVFCAADDLWPRTERNTIAYLFCGNNMMGVQIRNCKNSGVGLSQWTTVDSTNCYISTEKPTPGDKNIFIRIPMVLNGININDFEDPSVYELFRNSFGLQLTSHSVASSNVIIESVSAVSETSVKVVMRICIAESEKDSFTKLFSDFVTQNNGLLLSTQTSGNPKLAAISSIQSSSSDFTYQKNGLATNVIILIVVLVIIVVCILAVVVFCIVVRTKGKGNKGHKHLDGKKKVSSTKAATAKTTSKAVKV